MEQEQAAFISAVHLKGYKSIRDVAVELKQGLNIIIGANGSGKTNFLAFLNGVCWFDYALLFNGQNRKFESEITATPFSTKTKGERVFQSQVKGASYQIERSRNNQYSVTFLSEDKKTINTKGEVEYSSYDFSTLLLQIENPLNNILQGTLALNLTRYSEEDNDNVEYNLLGLMLKRNNEVKTFLDKIFDYFDLIYDNSKISDIINQIFENQWFIIDDLRQNLRQFSPIKDINIDWGLTRKTIQEDENGDETASIDNLSFQFFINKEWINWNQLSDGTKRLFYLIGSVTYADENQIILMEEPELGVHPHQLTLLMNFLKTQSLEKQIIISTHSPQVLNCLKEDELDRIIVARHEGKLGTKMYHLSEEEKGYASEYMQNQAFLSDYWLQSGFVNEETEDIL